MNRVAVVEVDLQRFLYLDGDDPLELIYNAQEDDSPHLCILTR